MSQLNNPIYVLTYGSLRKGEYNYERMGSPEYIKTSTLKGWKLFDLGSYPGAVFTGNKEDTIVVDLLKLSIKQSSNIDSMEIGANYHTRVQVVEVKENLCAAKIYEYIGSTIDRNQVVSGDWSNYLKKTHAEI